MKVATKKTEPQPFYSLSAQDLMTVPVMTIPHHVSLQEAAVTLSKSHISGAPVVDLQGKCIGVLSSSDFVTWAKEGGPGEEVGKMTCFIAPWGEMINVEDSNNAQISQYMTAKPVTVAPTTTLGDIAQKMAQNHIHRVLVVSEENCPCGIVTSTDILAAVAQAAIAQAPRRGSHEGKN